MYRTNKWDGIHPYVCRERIQSDVVDVDLPVPELESTFFFVLAESICLVDLGVFGELSVSFDWKTNGKQNQRLETRQQLDKNDVRFRASSAVYLTMTSALSSWKSRRERRTMSP